MLGRRSKIGSSSIRQAGQHATPFREVYTRNPTQQARESGAAWKPSLSATKHCSTSRPHKTHDQRHSQPPNSQHAPARPQPPEETAYTVGPERHSGRNPRRRRGCLPEARDNGGPDGKAKDSLTLKRAPTWHSTRHPVPHLLHSTHIPQRRLLPKCYAFPRQMNHQQRKPTRPPTTTTAATEIPAIAPVERPLLFALEDAQLDPSALGAYPSTHSVHVLTASGHALQFSDVHFWQVLAFFLYPSPQTAH